MWERVRPGQRGAYNALRRRGLGGQSKANGAKHGCVKLVERGLLCPRIKGTAPARNDHLLNYVHVVALDSALGSNNFKTHKDKGPPSEDTCPKSLT